MAPRFDGSMIWWFAGTVPGTAAATSLPEQQSWQGRTELPLGDHDPAEQREGQKSNRKQLLTQEKTFLLTG